MDRELEVEKFFRAVSDFVNRSIAARVDPLRAEVRTLEAKVLELEHLVEQIKGLQRALAPRVVDRDRVA